MDALITSVVENLASGAPQFLYALGWVLFLLERYYLAGKRESAHREDHQELVRDYKELSNRSQEVLSRFATLLEVIKDRLGRGS